MPSSHLILVKHSAPEIVPGVPAAQWQLSDVGRARCMPLAQRLAPYRPALIASSIEPKATQTAALVAGVLRCPLEVVEGLHEHERRNVGLFMGQDEFEAAVATSSPIRTIWSSGRRGRPGV